MRPTLNAYYQESHMYRQTIARFALFAIPLIATHGRGVAQQHVGGLHVLVTDQTGSVIPGAEVEFRSPALIRPVLAVTDEHGSVFNSNLPPGNYSVKVRAEDFQTVMNEDVLVQIGRTFLVEMPLEVGRVDSTIVVEAGTAVIDTFNSEQASIFSGDRLTNAAGGRDFTEYARYTPSVNIEALAGNVSHKGRTVRGISVDGSSGAENVFYVDGIDTTSMYNGLNNQNLRVETVQEFQLKTAGYEAEFG
ncbi:MAG: carboxypeptidase-like regulatory domain-containing protein, partial [Bryobacterales bacterium]|nr:carboxypeptidase-like regulatory domain-containing protein [Bryobacterales bacterium]